MEASSIRVEPVGAERTDLVHRLTQAAFAEFQGVLEPPSGAEAETAEVVAADIADGGAAVAWIGQEAVGTVRYASLPDHLYVGRLGVLPSHRGRGVATALMAFAEAQAASLESLEVRVEVRSALPGNVAFFRRCGFAVVEERPHHRSPTETTVVLAKSVPQGCRGTRRSS